MKENSIGVDVHKTLLAANKCYLGLLKRFRLNLISKKTMAALCKTVFRPVSLYA